MTNKKKIFLVCALAGMTSYAAAQELTIQPIEASASERTELVITAEDMAQTTALQFNLQLPEGVTLDESAIQQGEATSDHTLVVRTLESGIRLVVLYSQSLATMTDGVVLRLPVTLPEKTGSLHGSLSRVRTATTDAVSHASSNVSFYIYVKPAEPSAVTSVAATPQATGRSYTLDGKPARKGQRGIRIAGGRKVIKK